MNSDSIKGAAAVAEGLTRLNARVRHDLHMLALGPENWVPRRTHFSGSFVYDAIIIGGGQSGLGAAFGLIREGVRRILVLDENVEGEEGPWLTYARMITLRTPKHLTAIDFGIPSLTFRAWWEAQWGRVAWDRLDKIPREQWMRYLVWYRDILDLPVKNQARVTRTEPLEPGLFRLTVEGKGAPPDGMLLTRKVIFATGIQGGGEWHVPRFIREALPTTRYAHSSSRLDFVPLKGKRVGILGGGASAFDNALHALNSGVREVHVFVRRNALAAINPIRYIENSGLLRHMAFLPDAEKYEATGRFLGHSQPPTNDTFNRAAQLPGFRLHLGAPWEQVSETSSGAVVRTPKGNFTFDYLIVSTGLMNDLKLRPELKDLASDVLLWGDRYTPKPEDSYPLVDAHPYLGPGFEFIGRNSAASDRLYGLFLFNYAALASLGLSASSLSGLREALPRLVSAVTAQLFLDVRETILAGYETYSQQEFLGKWPAA